MEKFLSDFEEKLVSDIISKQSSRGDKHKYAITALKIILNTILFILAYMFRESKLLILFLFIFWVEYIAFSLAYLKVNSLYSKIIFKFHNMQQKVT